VILSAAEAGPGSQGAPQALAPHVSPGCEAMGDFLEASEAARHWEWADARIAETTARYLSAGSRRSS